jgi:hypothetical protein
VRRLRPVTTTMGALAGACVMVSGCAATGARGEGPAPSPSAPRTASTASLPAIARDKRALATMVRRDTSVSEDVRHDLTPCAGDVYPVSTDSGDLTSGDGPDLVVNVTTCGNGLGVAAYVYRMVNGKYLNVFADERPPVYGSVQGGRLEIIHEVYKVDDPDFVPAGPTGQESVVYAWRGGHFVQVERAYADFGARTPTVSPEPTSTEPAPRPDSDPLDPELPAATTPAGPGSGPVDGSGAGTVDGSGSGSGSGSGAT